MASGPSRLNLGMLLIALVIGGAGYWVWKFFPHYFMAMQVDHILNEGGARAYTLNRMKGLDQARAKAALVDELRHKVVDLGVVDPDMVLDLTLDGDTANAVCNYRAVVVHPLVNRFTVLQMHRTAKASLKSSELQ